MTEEPYVSPYSMYDVDRHLEEVLYPETISTEPPVRLFKFRKLGVECYSVVDTSTHKEVCTRMSEAGARVFITVRYKIDGNNLPMTIIKK